MKKRTFFKTMNYMIILLLSFISLSACSSINKNAFPAFDETKKEIAIVARKPDIEITEEQSDEFYAIARGVVGEHANMAQFDDHTLYVQKEKKEKGLYFIEYVCENPTTNIRFTNKMNVKILDNDMEDYEYEWEMIESDLWEFLEVF